MALPCSSPLALRPLLSRPLVPRLILSRTRLNFAPSPTRTARINTIVMAFWDKKPPHGQLLLPSSAPPPPSSSASSSDWKLWSLVLAAFLAFGTDVRIVTADNAAMELRLTEKIGRVDKELSTLQTQVTSIDNNVKLLLEQR